MDNEARGLKDMPPGIGTKALRAIGTMALRATQVFIQCVVGLVLVVFCFGLVLYLNYGDLLYFLYKIFTAWATQNQ